MATADHYADAFSSITTTGDVKDAYLYHTSAMPEDEQKYGQAAGTTKKATTPECNDNVSQDGRLLQRADVQHYQSLLTGALMFATTIFAGLIDIAHAVNMLDCWPGEWLRHGFVICPPLTV